MTVIECMDNRFHDGVLTAAMTRDPDAFEEVKKNYNDLITYLPEIDLYGRTREEATADALHRDLEKVVVNHFVQQYTRSDMLDLLNLLLRADKAENISVQICSGLILSLSDLCRYWNQQHPMDRPIEYVFSLYEMP